MNKQVVNSVVLFRTQQKSGFKDEKVWTRKSGRSVIKVLKVLIQEFEVEYSPPEPDNFSVV